MAEYTPTTEEVREIFYDAPGMQRPSLAGHFDRWLDGVTAVARAEGERAAAERIAEAIEGQIIVAHGCELDRLDERWNVAISHTARIARREAT